MNVDSLNSVHMMHIITGAWLHRACQFYHWNGSFSEQQTCCSLCWQWPIVDWLSRP